MNSLTIVSISHLPSLHLKRWLAAISVILVATLELGAIAPTAQAAPSETTATVFSVPGWDYANVRSGPSTGHVVVNTIPAGSTVTLGCSTHGGNATGPYGTSDLWYKVSGTDSYIADVMILTGSDEAVTEACREAAPAPTQTSTEQPHPVTGRFAQVSPDVPMWRQLLNYYYNNKDSGPVVIDWAFFGQPGDHFVKWIYDQNIPIDTNPTFAPGSDTARCYEATVENDGDDMYLSLHRFDVWRTSENCFVIHDTYDFAPPYLPMMLDGVTGAAHVYEIYASGCYPPGSGSVR
ncbi:SH3 domain-containing protein [Actinomyces oricola]|uniref:SH3 domain-containing protein n=1 Tax=Actinomyces oricola TaxID=206043 RepID=UPI0013E8BF0E|nr:SH3 domain-containing protein [Actinomyces oricola]